MSQVSQSDNPFAFHETKDGRIHIFHCGKVVTTLAGTEAKRFLQRSTGANDPALQLLIAKVTGNFKRGNER